MRKIAAIAAVLLAGCSELPAREIRQPNQSDAWPLRVTGEDRTLRTTLVRDAETGCEYVVVSWHEATITPRLKGDGKPLCGGVQ